MIPFLVKFSKEAWLGFLILPLILGLLFGGFSFTDTYLVVSISYFVVLVWGIPMYYLIKSNGWDSVGVYVLVGAGGGIFTSWLFLSKISLMLSVTGGFVGLFFWILTENKE